MQLELSNRLTLQILCKSQSTSMQSHLQNFRQKRNNFAVSIRREKRNKIIKDLRAKYLQVLTEQIQLHELVGHFDLSQDPKFSKQEIQSNPLILVDILLLKQENLRRITFKNCVNKNMIDEKLLAPEQSSFELEEVPLPKQYDFKIQASLYQKISQDIDKNPGKYKKIQKHTQKKLIDFLIAFLKRNKYRQMAHQKQFQKVFINFLELFVRQIESPDLRKRILKWVEGDRSLRLISNCLPGTFMRYQEYTKLYDLVLKGMEHNDPVTKRQAINVLLKCTQKGDYDEVATVLEKNPQVFSRLLGYFEWIGQNGPHLNENEEILQSIKQAAYCVTQFLDCYEQTVYNCLLEGAGYVGGLLTTTNEPELIELGLRILIYFASIQDSTLISQTMQFLLSNSSIKASRLWQKMGQTYLIVRHENIEIRKSFISFISRLICNAGFEQIRLLNHEFMYPQKESLVQILVSMFIDNEELIMRYQILYSLLGIIYYAECVERTFAKLQDQLQTTFLEKISFKYVYFKIIESKMKSIVEEMEQRELNSETQIYQGYKGICGRLLDVLESFQKYDSENNCINQNDNDEMF